MGRSRYGLGFLGVYLALGVLDVMDGMTIRFGKARIMYGHTHTDISFDI